MKKYGCLFFVFLFVLSSCGIKEIPYVSEAVTTTLKAEESVAHPAYADIEYVQMSLTELTQQSPLILLAECQSIRDNTEKEIYETTFSIRDTLRGDFLAESIVVDSYAEEYTVGMTYYLFLEKFISVFYSRDHFMATAVPVQAGGPYNEVITDINDLTESALKEKIGLAVRNNAYEGPGYIGTSFTVSSEPGEIYEASEYVLKVKVNSVQSQTNDRMVVGCSVREQLKGDFDSDLLAVVPLESVQPGGEYILLLNRSSEQSVIFVVSSLSSVVLPNSEMAKQIIQLSGQTK